MASNAHHFSGHRGTGGGSVCVICPGAPTGSGSFATPDEFPPSSRSGARRRDRRPGRFIDVALEITCTAPSPPAAPGLLPDRRRDNDPPNPPPTLYTTQVLNASLLEGEVLSLEDTGGPGPSLLANESVLMRGLVVRSHSNQISISFRSDRGQGRSGFVILRYQAFVLSCAFPRRPAGGDVSVSRLQAGGEAFFVCSSGYRLQGPEVLTCRNATTPYWSGKEPTCVVSCGGMMKNATHGRIRLHVHFEKVALAEDDDRLLIKNGNNIDSPPVYDSYEVEYLPNEGVLSTGRHLFVEFTTDGTLTSTGAAIRYEAFAKGTCYEPFVKYGNFSSSDSGYGVGAVVEFSCNPGYTLEQGSVVIECVDAQNPQWNDTEPACRAVCSGEMTDSAGVVLSPNWPEVYDKGQDCIWGVHVEEDKRIMLDVQVKKLSAGNNRLQLRFHLQARHNGRSDSHAAFPPEFRATR
ncbi:unnamed protein product, partial [Gadus morhua 'NCC']